MPQAEWTSYSRPAAENSFSSSQSTYSHLSAAVSYVAHPAGEKYSTGFATRYETQRLTRTNNTVGENSTSYRKTDNCTTRETVIETVYDPTATSDQYQSRNFSTEQTTDSTVEGLRTRATGTSYTAGRSTYRGGTTTTHSWSWTTPTGTGSSSNTEESSRTWKATLSYASGVGTGASYIPSAVAETATETVTTSSSAGGTGTTTRTCTFLTSGYASMSVPSTTYQAAGYYVLEQASTTGGATVGAIRSTIDVTDFIFTRQFTGNRNAAWGRLSPGVYSPSSVSPPLVAHPDAILVVSDAGKQWATSQSGYLEWGTAYIPRTCLVTQTEETPVGIGTMPFTRRSTITRTNTVATEYSVYGVSPGWTYDYTYAVYRDMLSAQQGYFEQSEYGPVPTAFIGAGYGIETRRGISSWSPLRLIKARSSSFSSSAGAGGFSNSTFTGYTLGAGYTESRGALGYTLGGQAYLQDSRYSTMVSESWLAAWGASQYDDTIEFRGLVYTMRSTAGFAAVPGGSAGSNLDGGPFSPVVTEVGSTSPNGPAVPVLVGAGVGDSYSTTYLGSNSFSYAWSGGRGTSTFAPVGAEVVRTVAIPFFSDSGVPARMTVGTFGQDITLTLVQPSYSWSWIAEVRFTSINGTASGESRTLGTLEFVPWYPQHTVSTLLLRAGHYLLAEMPSVSIITNSCISRVTADIVTYLPWNQTASFDPWSGL